MILRISYSKNNEIDSRRKLAFDIISQFFFFKNCVKIVFIKFQNIPDIMWQLQYFFIPVLISSLVLNFVQKILFGLED